MECVHLEYVSANLVLNLYKNEYLDSIRGRNVVVSIVICTL